MIIEITKDKMTAIKINKDVYEQFAMWFLNHTEEWVKREELENYIGISNVRAYINKLRCDGFTIISNNTGYCFTTNKDEIKKCYDKLRNRALTALTAARKMKKML